MKTLYLTESSANIFVDPETNTVGTLHTEDRYDIRSVYYMDEPMHVVYNHGENKEEIDAKKGDILLLFYSNRYNKYILDTIKTKQWAANIKNRRKIEQAEKEAWAAKNAETPCCDCSCKCDDCTNCNLTEAEAPKKENVLKKVINKIKKSKKA